jgi:hypothetical protein
MKQSFMDFCNEVSGFKFYSKRTKQQVYRFQMYWAGLTPYECFNRFDTRIIVKDRNYEK